MYKSIISDIDNLINYVETQGEKGWVGTLTHITNRYKKIISSISSSNLYTQGLNYDEIDDYVKGNDMEFEAILLNLKTLKDRLKIYEAEKNETYVEPCFEQIKEKIIEKINQANLCIWIVVAWFTDKDIYYALLKARERGINIQIIMLEDKSQNALDFRGKIEVIKAKEYIFGKENLHNKFCVFDFKTVITGSYNWTYQAIKNSEDVSIIQNSEHGQEYALRFVKLKSELKNNKTTFGK